MAGNLQDTADRHTMNAMEGGMPDMQASEKKIDAIAGMLHDVLGEIRGQQADRLWDAEDIANYTRLSKKTVQGHLVQKPGFPRPVILATGGRRWVPKEVKAWVLRHR
jgi:predicted DNA-binding transcriptional regulator AlpA